MKTQFLTRKSFTLILLLTVFASLLAVFAHSAKRNKFEAMKEGADTGINCRFEFSNLNELIFFHLSGA